jgi:hypothetical protein
MYCITRYQHKHTVSSILNRSGIIAASVLRIQFGNILGARLEQALNGRHVVYSLANTKQGQNNQQA